MNETNPIMQYFAFAHLPEKLQEVSKPVGELASVMEQSLPNGPEKSAGLRKLFEAKDCFVRAALSRTAVALFALSCLLPIEASACHLGSRLAEARPVRRVLRAAVAPLEVSARRVRGCRGGK